MKTQRIRVSLSFSNGSDDALENTARAVDAHIYQSGSFTAIPVQQAVLETAVGTPLGTSVGIGSSLLAPIFSRGRLQSELQFASAVQVEVVERYRQRVLAALAEVEDARSANRRSAERAQLLDAIVDEARLTARLANVRYIEGEEDLLSVLNAQTSLSDSEDAQVIGWQERMFAQIALYRSMGGH